MSAGGHLRMMPHSTDSPPCQVETGDDGWRRPDAPIEGARS